MGSGSFQWCTVTGQEAQTEMQEVPSEHEKKLFILSDRALEEADRRCFGFSFSEDTQNLSEHFPVQPAVGF